jgi:hypothetical protein
LIKFIALSDKMSRKKNHRIALTHKFSIIDTHHSSAGSFLYFQSGSFFKSAKIIQRHIIGKNWRFILKWALNIGFLPPGMSMPCMLKQYMPVQCTAMSCVAMPSKPCHASHVMHANAVH